MSSSRPIAIETHSLGKKYYIGASPFQTNRLGEAVVEAAKSLGARRRSASSEAQSSVWALRDLDLEIEEGKVVGIIGSNGAGKSTLLKVLSRITPPTTGTATIKGTVASLLEVGTGFHPELTGRENIYLSGSVLGMTRREVETRFTEIVDFSGLHRFLDTPVKRYSSGMYVRLGFSVAAHLRSDVLIVDEVLAVGDAAFQRESLGKMQEASSAGRTVLFVSHDMAAISRLCSSAHVLSGGRAIYEGAPQDAIAQYMADSRERADSGLANRPDRVGDGSLRITDVVVESSTGGRLTTGSPLRVTISYSATESPRHFSFRIGFYDLTGQGIYVLDSDAEPLPDTLPSSGSVVCTTEPIHITPGECYVNVSAQRNHLIADYIQQALYFHVYPGDYYETGAFSTRDRVLCAVRQFWGVDDAAGT